MRCLKCGEIFAHKIGNLEIDDKILGNLVIPDTEYKMCEKCGEILYSPVTLRAIEKVEEERKNQLLLDKPLKDFIQGAEVGRILGISRQAVHKQRIKRGFIHFVRYMDKILYHRESVELYKKTGDGRFQLAERSPGKDSGIIKFSDLQKARKEATQKERTETAGSSLVHEDLSLGNKIKDRMPDEQKG